MVSIVELTEYDKIDQISDDLLDFEYHLLNKDSNINLFEFQKVKWDLLEFKKDVNEDSSKTCYMIPNIIYKYKKKFDINDVDF